MSSPVSYDLQGQGGGEILAAGDSATKNIRWIQCLTDCVFNTISSPNLANASSIVGVTIPAGVGIGGLFDDVELTSGLAAVYYV
jgi:hypothetical protein